MNCVKYLRRRRPRRNWLSARPLWCEVIRNVFGFDIPKLEFAIWRTCDWWLSIFGSMGTAEHGGTLKNCKNASHRFTKGRLSDLS
jgi:hypothetical protein